MIDTIIGNMNLLDWIYRIGGWVLGGVFIYSGIAKLFEPQIFATLIEAYGIIPENLITSVAIVLPILELLAGVGIIFDIKGSLSMIFCMLVLFMIILGYGIMMELDVDCGCFGPQDPESKAFHGLRQALARDIVMVNAIAFMYAWRKFKVIQPVKLTTLIKNLTKEAES